MGNEDYTPTGHHILVDVEKVEEVSKGGIVLPADLLSKEQVAAVRATVLKIGPDAWFDKISRWAQVGDKVITAKFAGFGLTPTLRVINDEDILCVVNPKEK
jgi:co-chaperonin GroES (HSP10)